MFKNWFKHSSTPKIEVFVRHCHYSVASAQKERHLGFSHEKCFENLLETADLSRVNFTFLLDTHFGKNKTHFIERQTDHPVVEIDAGCEAQAFLDLIDYVLTQKLSDTTILYFLEDDYLHRNNWTNVLLEAFTLDKADYVTLFDHRDKYFDPMYEGLQSEIFHTQSCHFRTTVSTTNTYAMRMGTLKKHLSIHREFSENRSVSADHETFLALGRVGATLLSSIPGYSTHAEPKYASPCHDWGGLYFADALK